MERVKAGAVPGAAPQGSAGAGPDGGSSPSDGSAPLAVADGSAEGASAAIADSPKGQADIDMLGGELLVEDDAVEGQGKDPVLEKAITLANLELAHVA
eukprot:4870839-Alexandrium_andersonii.AAC.1